MSDMTRLPCFYCTRSFTTREGVEEHQRAKHFGIRSAPKRIKFAADRGGRCWHCGDTVDPTTVHTPKSATRDHKIPKALNGGNSQANSLLACQQCNGLRGHADAEAFRRLMRGEAVTRVELWPHIFPGDA